MQSCLTNRWAITSGVLLLVLAAPISAHANCMCAIIPAMSLPFYAVGFVMAVVIYVIARRTAGTKVALAATLGVGTALTGIPALACAGYAVFVALSCGHTWGWLFVPLFALYAAGVVLAGRAVARRKPKASASG